MSDDDTETTGGYELTPREVAALKEALGPNNGPLSTKQAIEQAFDLVAEFVNSPDTKTVRDKLREDQIALKRLRRRIQTYVSHSSKIEEVLKSLSNSASIKLDKATETKSEDEGRLVFYHDCMAVAKQNLQDFADAVDRAVKSIDLGQGRTPEQYVQDLVERLAEVWKRHGGNVPVKSSVLKPSAGAFILTVGEQSGLEACIFQTATQTDLRQILLRRKDLKGSSNI